jgi:diguanylate cyclase (GGDEF)-like protein
MELALWRWSTAVQITSAVLIAGFFVILGRRVLRAELRPWIHAWLANLAALGVTTIFWFVQPDSQLVFMLIRFAYILSKTLFVVLLVRGAWAFLGRRATHEHQILTAITIFALAGAYLLDSINKLGVAQSTAIALILVPAAIVMLAREGVPGLGWLAFGFLVRSALAVAESFAYGSELMPRQWPSAATLNIFLASHSSLDSGAEWVIALGCVLTLYGAIEKELTTSNSDLLAAKDVLQQLVDRDPLTGLANRRALPTLLNELAASGVTILFFDLNDFKTINDSYGHAAGDECLKRFARALRDTYRPEDHVVRYGGDEFVVVAGGLSPQEALDRTDILEGHLRQRGEMPIRFSVGHSFLEPDGALESALLEADQAMYRNKLAAPRLRLRRAQ